MSNNKKLNLTNFFKIHNFNLFQSEIVYLSIDIRVILFKVDFFSKFVFKLKFV